MNKKASMTFVENEDSLFEVQHENSDKECLSHQEIFVATFVFKNGEKETEWVSHTYEYHQERHEIVHSLHSTTKWFEFAVKVDGTMYGVMRKNDPHVSVWMTSGFFTYYYDKYGMKEGIQALDEEGENIKENPKTCPSCEKVFLVTVDFENGKCPACVRYEDGRMTKPALELMRWDVQEV